MLNWLKKKSGLSPAPGAASVAPGAADRLFALGVQAEREGKPQEACAHYREAIAASPGHAAAHLNLGIALEAAGEAAAAITAYEAALHLNPQEPYAGYNLGKLLYTRGELARAEQVLRVALRRKPDFAEALVVLSRVLESLGEPAQALSTLESALRVRPDYAGALRNSGLLLARLGRWAEAETILRRALAADAADADALCWLGNALVRLERTDEAAECYRRALRLQSDFAEPHCYLGCILAERGQRDEASTHLHRAVALKPGLAEAHLGLGNLHYSAQQLEESASSYRRAIALDAGFVEAHANLGHVLASMGQPDAALEAYATALSLDPDYAQARWSRVMCRIPALRWTPDDLARSRRAFSVDLAGLEQWFDEGRSPAGHRAVGVQQPFWLAYQEENNVELLRRYGRLCSRLMALWLERREPPPPARRATARVRVGIVSQHFREHSVWNALIKGWLERLDHERFEITAYCLAAAEDAETQFARSRAARFVQAAGDLQHWVDAILDARPDVLIYPEIGMDPMTLKLASLRLAPLQAAAWGHPETTGLPTIDCFLSAQDLEPAAAQAHYTERLVALPHLGCFLRPAAVDAVAPDLGQWGIDADSPLLLCPGTPFKYAPEHDAVLPAIARQLGRCQFVFFTHWTRELSGKLHRRLASAFEREGLDAERYLRFVPWLSRPAFYGLMQRADVFLDSIGFSGFNTALQAVECALPVVAREGYFLRGRLASGLLKRLDLQELVTTTETEYAALAVRLVRDRAFREDIRRCIAARRHLLYEDHAPILALEQFLAQGV